MIRFRFHPSPNPLKAALFLEESGLPYEAFAVDTCKGEQHAEGSKEKLAFKAEMEEDAGKRMFPQNACLPS
ncbi:MAG: glutathione S-transferase [Herminiimonas sp.]|nr:glutathione S-transferase [Herminiimonas sp.]